MMAIRPLQSMGTWQRVGFVAGILAFAAVALIPSGLHNVENAGARPAYAAGVALCMAIWWLSEAIPIAITACLPILLFPIFGVFGKGLAGDVSSSLQPYVDGYIFLFMGGMGVGAAMEESHLHKRIALHIMLRIGTRPKQLLLGILVATAAVSLWISNTATAVMMLPISLALVRELEVRTGSPRLVHFGTAAMLAVAYGANIGGIGTKIGTGTNSIFCGFASETMKVDIGFMQFVALGLPFVVIFIPLAAAVLWQLGKRDAPEAADSGHIIREQLSAMGSLSTDERKVAIVFGTAAVLWIFGDLIRPLIAPLVPYKMQGKHYEAGVAMAAALVLIALRALSLQALKRVPWSTLLLLGGSFAMAAGIEGSGLAKWMALKLKIVEELPVFAQLLVATSASVALSAVASNTATINVMLNVLPRSLPILAAATMASSCDFALPAGTPPNAIVFGAGYIRLPTMMRVGVVLDLAAAIVIAVYAYLYLPFVL